MLPIFLAGQPHTTDRAETVCAPWTGEAIAEVALASTADVEAALVAADCARATTAALPTWRRAAILRAIADAIAARADELAATLSAEACKPIDLARGEVARSRATFAVTASELEAMRGDVIPMDVAATGERRVGMTRLVAAGPVAAITPFNFPLNLAAHKVAPAVAAGCPIVLKPANKTPLSALKLGEIVLAAGWPEAALSVLNLAIGDAAPLVEDPRIRVLTFTGSDRVGWQMKARAGKKKVLLELGGDAAAIVEADAPDWSAMIARLAVGAFAYSGQVCISVQRIYVQRSVYPRFVADLVAHVEGHVGVGAPDERGVLVSALIDDAAAQRIALWTRQTVAMGAQVLCGGRRGGAGDAGGGRVFDPMVLIDVPPASPLGCNEAFGPLVTIWPYDDLDEAFAAVNASRFGLQAAVYSSRLDIAMRAFAALEVGAVLVNEMPTFRVDHMPYGGVKDSGVGREGPRYAIRDYSEERMLVMPSCL